MHPHEPIERHLRVAEVARLTGLSVAAIRHRVGLRQIAYRKPSRAILIPESEVARLLGILHPRAESRL